MKLIFQLAFKNLIGSGLRTWLNVGVLAFAFIVIIFFKGILEGWSRQGIRDNIAWEYGAGQLQHADYDPHDPFSIMDSHGIVDPKIRTNLTPILIRQASIYPDGRMMSVLLKGIDINQKTLSLPTAALQNHPDNIPAIIGKNMAQAAKLKEGDKVLLRWRDQHGTFDAGEITVVKIFDTDVPTVDIGQIWIPLTKLWEMTGLQNHATLLIANEAYTPQKVIGWTFKTQDDLLENFYEIVATESAGSALMYLMLLAIALLAIFDTQVLSVFRRQKEIGTYLALGMTRSQVLGLFTIEGAMYSLLAMVAGAIIGTPLFLYLANTGISIPESYQDMGITIGRRLYPSFSVVLILNTVILLIISSTIVSYIPARKISKMNPVLALKGKIQ